MKKTRFLATITILFSSCSFPAYDNLYYTDFTRYANDDFFVSSVTDYAGAPYAALGDIIIEHYPGNGKQQEWSNTQDMLDRLVRAAKKAGANGIIGYTCHLTAENKYTPTKWIASGIAVHFDNLPNMPKTLLLEETTENKVSQAAIVDKEEIANFAKQTIDYLIENDTKFIIWSAVHGDLYFDLNQKEHIPQQEFDAKYGEDAAYTIDMMYRNAKKAKRQASKKL